MNKLRAQRLYYILIVMFGISIAAALILYALKQNINLFLTPSQALTQSLPNHYTFRLGGQVKPQSMMRENNNLRVHFILTDLHRDIAVTYSGILPDLFREGSGAIAEGYWNDKHEFIATQILAKHDENYMPRSVSAALR